MAADAVIIHREICIFRISIHFSISAALHDPQQTTPKTYRFVTINDLENFWLDLEAFSLHSQISTTPDITTTVLKRF